MSWVDFRECKVGASRVPLSLYTIRDYRILRIEY